jgi:cupin superfamily acireductone dioxygenase involved in methionine salvage
VLPDDEFLDDAISLTYNVEIGELHERDKFSWIDVINITKNNEDEDILFKKVKFLDFEFKMNHIK